MKFRIYPFLGLVLVLLGLGIFIKFRGQSKSGLVPGQSKASRASSLTSLSSAGAGRLETKEYRVSYGDKTLYGQLTLPENPSNKRLPLVVLAHGFNNTADFLEDYATEIASQGYAVYRFDFYGGSTSSRSGGQDMLDMSVKTESQDLEAVLDQLKKESFVDSQSLYLLGVSQGGVVSTMVASHRDDIKGLMLIFPAYVLFDDVKETYASYQVASPSQLPDVISHKNARLGSIYLTDALNYDIAADMKAYKKPVLLVQGSQDQVVPYRYAQEAAQTFPDATLVRVEGAGHYLDDQLNQQAFPAISDFLAKNK